VEGVSEELRRIRAELTRTVSKGVDKQPVRDVITNMIMPALMTVLHI